MRWLALRRRWYVVAPILLVTVAAQWTFYHPAPVYQAVAVVELQPPEAESAADAKPNVYSDPRSSLAATAAEVALGLESPSGAARLRTEGLVGNYTMAPRNSGTAENPYYSLPRMDVTVETHDPKVAVASLDVLLADFGRSLVALQDEVGVHPDDRLTTQLLVTPSATQVFTSKSRAVLGATLLGVGAAVLVPGWLELYWTKRAARLRSTARAGQLA